LQKFIALIKLLQLMETEIIQKLIDAGLQNKNVLIFAIVVFTFYVVKSAVSFGFSVYTKLVKPSDVKELSDEIKDLTNTISNIQNEVKSLNDRSVWISQQLSTNDNMTERNKDYINSLKSDVSRIQNFIDVLKLKIK
jgi:peptidoglycan hydrolase CwlO-like protein